MKIMQRIFINYIFYVYFISLNNIIHGSDISSFNIENPVNILDYTSSGIIVLKADRLINLRIFSSSGPYKLNSEISFTNIPSKKGDNCDDIRKTDIFKVMEINEYSAKVSVKFTDSDALLDTNLMFCLRSVDLFGHKSTWKHQGNFTWLQIKPKITSDLNLFQFLIIKSVFIPILMFFSALFSGLALNLLSLTKAELKVLRNQGSSEERRYAKVVMPLRKRGNLLFCTLLLMNTLVNVAITVLFYELIDIYSILAATLSIVFLGEILPQTICSRFGLSFGNKMAWLTNIFIIITFPFTYPVSIFMNLILQKEVPNVYNRDQFQEILKARQTNNQTKTGELDIKSFQLSNKCVKDLMTKLEDIYMEEFNSELSSDMVAKIFKMGYTRIPIYEHDKNNVVALLHVKDLALINPSDNLCLKTVCKFYNRPINFVFEDTKVNVMLEEFKKGQSHMAFIQKVNNEGLGDPFYETIGMITLEDVLEDIFNSEATTEPILYFKDKELQLNQLDPIKANRFNLFNLGTKEDSVSKNLLLAAQHFLSNTIGAFNPDLVSQDVLERLINLENVVHSEKKFNDGLTNRDNMKFLLQNGKSINFFILILSGNVVIDIGAEHFLFEEGPFSYFGLQALLETTNNIDSNGLVFDPLVLTSLNDSICNRKERLKLYTPDFTLLQVSDNLQYLKINQELYLSSLYATKLYASQEVRTSLHCESPVSQEARYNLLNKKSNTFDYSGDGNNKYLNEFTGSYDASNVQSKFRRKSNLPNHKNYNLYLETIKSPDENLSEREFDQDKTYKLNAEVSKSNNIEFNRNFENKNQISSYILPSDSSSSEINHCEHHWRRLSHPLLPTYEQNNVSSTAGSTSELNKYLEVSADTALKDVDLDKSRLSQIHLLQNDVDLEKYNDRTE